MNPLALDRETMRAMGYRTVDLMLDLMTDRSDPACRRATPAEMAARLPFGQPSAPTGFDALLDKLATDVVPFMSRTDHPGYLGFIPGSGTFPGALGDFMAAALNMDIGNWMESAGPSRLELVVVDWFKEWVGYPSSAAGLLLSGGSQANIQALAVARHALAGEHADRLVVYAGDQAHSSVARAARLLGFRAHQLRLLPTDDDQRLSPETLSEAIEADLRVGRRPLFVSACGGATSTGAVDPLIDLAVVCSRHGVWLHVDGAYGAFAALTERGRAQLAGIELADSVTLDPHKWLYQPFECGALLVRDGELLRQTFSIAPPDYLADTVGGEREVNFYDLGTQLSRTSRALKVWLSLSYFGVDAFREAINQSLDCAHYAQAMIEATPALELMSPASLGIVCFRRRGSDALNARIVADFEASGMGLVSSTRVGGRYAVRLCPMNHTTTFEDVERALRFFATAPESVPSRPWTTSCGSSAHALPSSRRQRSQRAGIR